jgi:hypothetical protein
MSKPLLIISPMSTNPYQPPGTEAGIGANKPCLPPGTEQRPAWLDHRPSWRWNVFAIVGGVGIALGIVEPRVSWSTLLAWFAIVYVGELAWWTWGSKRQRG